MKINGFNSQIHTETAIVNALSSGRFPHAAIIEGGTYAERTELGKRIASALVCNDSNERPCGQCNHCHKSSLGLHPDILLENPHVTDSGNILYSVDDIRKIRNSAFIVPNEADKKVFVLNDAQVMNNPAQNALLKILEEPPAYAVFILLCSTKSAFLPTVISRSTMYLLTESHEIKGDFPEEQILECSSKIVEAASASNDFELVKAAAAFEKNPKFLEACLPVISEMFACALRIKFGAEPEPPEYEVSNIAATKMSKNALLNACESLEIIRNALSMNANLNLTITRMCTLLRQKENI